MYDKKMKAKINAKEYEIEVWSDGKADDYI